MIWILHRLNKEPKSHWRLPHDFLGCQTNDPIRSNVQLVTFSTESRLGRQGQDACPEAEGCVAQRRNQFVRGDLTVYGHIVNAADPPRVAENSGKPSGKLGTRVKQESTDSIQQRVRIGFVTEWLRPGKSNF